MARATEMGARPGWHQLNQYKNPANPDAHFRTTGPEVWRQTQGAVTHFVAGLGTCGTITGTGRYLKSKNKDVKVMGVHPQEGHDIPGVRSLRQLRLADFFSPPLSLFPPAPSFPRTFERMMSRNPILMASTFSRVK